MHGIRHCLCTKDRYYFHGKPIIRISENSCCEQMTCADASLEEANLCSSDGVPFTPDLVREVELKSRPLVDLGLILQLPVLILLG